jgi:hypothetical protein
MKRPIYIAIMAAFEARRGIHLTADEVHELAQDDAIVHRAGVELEDDDAFVVEPDFTWTAALRSASHPPEKDRE